jgi:hypothetical protein
VSETRQAWAGGLSIFAGAIMITAGVLNALQGLAAIVNDQFFVRVGDYAFKLDVTAWGWIHLVLGILVALAGVFVLTGAEWSRIVGIALAIISVVANFLSLPYYPLWSVVVISLDVAVVWALATWRPSRL